MAYALFVINEVFQVTGMEPWFSFPRLQPEQLSYLGYTLHPVCCMHVVADSQDDFSIARTHFCHRTAICGTHAVFDTLIAYDSDSFVWMDTGFWI